MKEGKSNNDIIYDLICDFQNFVSFFFPNNDGLGSSSYLLRIYHIKEFKKRFVSQIWKWKWKKRF